MNYNIKRFLVVICFQFSNFVIQETAIEEMPKKGTGCDLFSIQ